MARYFIRLKLTLLGAALRLSWQQAIGFVLSILVGIPLSIGGFYLLRWLGGEAAGGSGLRLAFAVLTVLWVVGPPLLFGLDETLDPGRLRLLPLSRRQVAIGLLASSAVGVGPGITLVMLLGAVVGFAPLGPGAPIVVAAVVAQFLLCLTAARAVTTVLSRWLRSRRGQDVLVIAGATLGIGMAALGQIPNILVNLVGDYRAFASLLDRIETVVGVTPFAWAGSSVLAVSEGRLLAGVGWLFATGGLIAALAASWMRALDMATQTTADTRSGADAPLFSGVAALLPRNRLGAAAARELRYQWRVPQLRAQWIFIPFFGVALVVGALLAPRVSPLLVFAMCGLIAFHGFSAINAFGGDRGAVWLLLASGRIDKRDIAAKNLAGTLVLLPLAAVLATLLATVSDGWHYVVPALLGGVAVLGTAYGIGNVASTLTPTPIPESAGNVWAGSSGSGCAAAIGQGLAMMVGTVLLLPAVAAMALAVANAQQWLGLVGLLVAGYGVALWWVGLHLAAKTADRRGPEIVATLSRRV